ncbi:MAG: hypothetical protein Fur002_02610 [Anaerolineales bacterium]
MTLSKNPVFNLRATLQETGIAADTLRAWERRYGLPMPQRTPGGHRLYSQYDVEVIKWLQARLEEGLSISRAVDMWNEHTAAGIDLLASVIPSTQTLPAVYLGAETTLDALRQRWIESCMAFNEPAAEQTLNQAFAVFPAEAVCADLLQKGMSEIGGLWYRNKASVQQEHFASALAMRRLEALMSAAPAPTRSETVMVGCPAGEWHTFVALMMAFFLRRRGLKVIYLGANVPHDQFQDAVQSAHANLVILVAQTLTTAAALSAAARALSDSSTLVGFGGRIFNLHPDLQARIHGVYLGGSIPSALEKAERLLRGKHKPAAPTLVPPEYSIALQSFKSKRTHIEGSLKESLPFVSEGFNAGIQFLGDNILAALQLGDMNYVSLEMDWTKSLLLAYSRPPEELAYFMRSYSDAVEKHINGQGSPIKTWLKSQAEQIA